MFPVVDKTIIFFREKEGITSKIGVTRFPYSVPSHFEVTIYFCLLVPNG